MRHSSHRSKSTLETSGRTTPLPPPTPGGEWIEVVQAALIVAAGLVALWPVFGGGWVWDDPQQILLNATLRDPQGWWKFWIAPTTEDYFPLKFTLHWVMWQLWGADPAGYHFVNVALHLLGALLVWRVLKKLGVRLAWFGGLLFAIHPLAVESVAWVSEIKNTASLPPLLLGLCAYLDFDERGRKRDYVAALGWFVAAMLIKTSVVMLPVVILLLAWWKRRAIVRADVLASAPFFGVSLVLGAVTVWFQQTRAIQHEILPMGGFVVQVVRAGLAIVFYLAKGVVPLGLLPIYPRWVVDPPTLALFLPWPCLAVLVGCLWLKRATWGRHALLGLGFFVINLVPVLGFLPMSYMRFSWVADHFVYISLVGLVGLAAAGAGLLLDHVEGRARRVALAGMAILCGTHVALSFRHAENFSSETTLWTYTLRGNPDTWQAHDNLGLALIQQDRLEEAAVHFEAAIRVNPDCDDAHYNLANVLLRLRRPAEAIPHYEEALRLKPASADAHINLGNVLMDGGNPEAALRHFDAGERLSPLLAQAHSNRANALARLNRLPEAVAEYEEALRLQPNAAVVHYNFGNVLARLNRFDEAMAHFEETLRLNPEFAEARSRLEYFRGGTIR